MSGNKKESKPRKPKRMYSADEKRKIVEEFLKSGLSARKFAPSYDIVSHTLSEWKK